MSSASFVRNFTTKTLNRRRVVVTGIGVVSPLGVGTQNAWKALLESKSGVVKLTDTFYNKLPCKIGKKNTPEFLNCTFCKNQ